MSAAQETSTWTTSSPGPEESHRRRTSTRLSQERTKPFCNNRMTLRELCYLYLLRTIPLRTTMKGYKLIANSIFKTKTQQRRNTNLGVGDWSHPTAKRRRTVRTDLGSLHPRTSNNSWQLKDRSSTWDLWSRKTTSIDTSYCGKTVKQVWRRRI